MKKSVLFLGLIVAMGLSSWAEAGESPILGGGNFGLGLEVGDPGVWGPVGMIWIDRENSFQPALKLGNGTALLQLDYLWHDYSLIKPSKGMLPFYLGVGGDVNFQNTVTLGARGLVGIDYLFNQENVPVDIYVQVVPELWFNSGATAFYVYGNLGSRYYF
ncbi:MAG TPA: hypothetical protein VHE12_10365 [bacterium]|nr:hypothetical protein [bacterium]